MRNPNLVPAGAMAASQDVAVSRRVLLMALAMLAIAAATILGALGFEHIGGYQPCALCLMQRVPYYLGVPLAAAAAIAAVLRTPRPLLVLLFGLFAALMLYSAGLGVYHAGVEWGFWEGPAACAPSVGVGSATEMLTQLGSTHAPSCTEATWRFLGLSFAGWNVIVSALLAGMAAYAGVSGLKQASRA